MSWVENHFGGASEYSRHTLFQRALNVLVGVALSIGQAPAAFIPRPVHAKADGFYTLTSTPSQLSDDNLAFLDVAARHCLASTVSELSNELEPRSQALVQDTKSRPTTVHSPNGQVTSLIFSLQPDKALVTVYREVGDERAGLLVEVPNNDPRVTIQELASAAALAGEVVSWDNPFGGSAGGVANREGQAMLYLPLDAPALRVTSLAGGMC